MTDEFIEPTPRGRRNLIILFVIGALYATAHRLWLQPALFDYINSLPLCDQLPWWRGLLISVLITLLFVAALSTRCALQIFQHGQWPLPGTWVFRRTKIQRGPVVRSRAYLLLVASALAVACAWFGWQGLSTTPIFHPKGKCASGVVQPGPISEPRSS
ncbi:hypothetical protein [Dyella tabacisoli]|uniref:Transmembrane protein n=1 Tax=Dyella tabacisoli TaxID=2282381 RepID=A0A369UMI6_9GAMM|nr:hypothetical protein DVJ77_09285 [Dyella tabacisoli]